MKATLTVGLSLTRSIRIERDRTIFFMGEQARVYATPDMVNDIEWACRDLILEHCDAGEDSVGTHVAVSHLAATPLGMTVKITVTVVAIAGRSVTCEATVHDGIEDVGRGRHTRFVVDVARTEARIADKAKRAGL